MTDTVDTIETLKMLPLYNFGVVIYAALSEHIPAIADLAPFRGGSQTELGYIANLYVLRLTNAPGLSGDHARGFLENEVAELEEKLRGIELSNRSNLFSALGERWYSSNIFTYVGPAPHSPTRPENFDLHSDINSHLLDWINFFLIPHLDVLNKERVIRGMPEPLTFNTGKIFAALWILESEETLRQGTAFMVKGFGLVTCEHVVGPYTYAFKADNFSKKYPVQVLKSHPVIDLAILQFEEEVDNQFLEREAEDNIKQLDQLAVVGFPNYRIGDTGTIVTGVVSGFRMSSGIRRILTSAPIIAGNSGGPVLNAQNKVIGVAVTGAERMEEAQETEDHGIIPIGALDLL